ncbi:cation:proton antiporter [Eubacteriaceae bacterium ES3]|nr:cation:proton antiporter [Eubacteriaceae bacterium ES3]
MENLPELFTAGLLLIIFFVISFLSHKLNIPSVLAFIILGLLLVPVLGGNEAIHLLAEIGIVLMFFVLGLEFPVAKILRISKTIWAAGLIDVVLNFGGAFVLALIFNLDLLSAAIIGGIVYASSSSITAKLLEDNKRLANVETEFMLALLIFEDLVSPILISFLAAMSSDQAMSGQLILLILLKVSTLTLGAIIIGHYGFSKLKDFIDNYIESDFLTFLMVGIAFIYSGLAIYLGLSEILGAFLAGVILSETGNSAELEHLLLPIRDFVLPFFFLWFGTTISFGGGIPMLPLLISLIVWSMIGKILVGIWGGKAFGLSKRPSYRAGLSLIQRGEFSVIIASIALPQLMAFSSVYIIVSAFIGVIFFQKAPAISKWIAGKKKQKTIKG